MKNKQISRKISVFHGLTVPEEGILVGYGAIIEKYKLPIPIPHKLALISTKNRQYNTESWQVFTPRHEPEDTLYKHLVFALKYEGINILVFKKLFDILEKKDVLEMIKIAPLGQYSRKIWFLYEWLLNKELAIPNLEKGNFVPLIDEKLQYAISGNRSSRHRIINNLPGTSNFCPLIYKNDKLESYITARFSEKTDSYFQRVHADILKRASAFLLLKDSKASFTIEGESPGHRRAERWGKAIGQAGNKQLDSEELIRLQHVIIESSRFTKMGFRKQEGFVGEHDRITGEPIPDHISARWQDIIPLIEGLINTNILLENSEFDAVLSAAIIAFGFVFIHPFVDGNGRIHRYIIHHILARKRYIKQGIIFPVSASILDHIIDYKNILESYSRPLLEFIDWETTSDHNIRVLNETIDYYRYFDATKQAEFLYYCVEDTIKNVIPAEVKYIQCYDEFKRYIDDHYEMPDKMVAMLARFLEQNNGILSQRAKKKEFNALTETEIEDIQNMFQKIFIPC